MRGRNRHITLMLHSAGSAISAGGGEGARGGGAGRGGVGARAGQTRVEAANRTARGEAARSSLHGASQQVIANSEGGSSSRSETGEVAVCQPPAPPAADLPSRALRRAPGPPARDHAAGGAGDAHGASLARLRPPGLLRAQPSRISTGARSARPRARPPPPGPPSVPPPPLGPAPRPARGHNVTAETHPRPERGASWDV